MFGYGKHYTTYLESWWIIASSRTQKKTPWATLLVTLRLVSYDLYGDLMTHKENHSLISKLLWLGSYDLYGDLMTHKENHGLISKLKIKEFSKDQSSLKDRHIFWLLFKLHELIEFYYCFEIFGSLCGPVIWYCTLIPNIYQLLVDIIWFLLQANPWGDNINWKLTWLKFLCYDIKP